MKNEHDLVLPHPLTESGINTGIGEIHQELRAIGVKPEHENNLSATAGETLKKIVGELPGELELPKKESTKTTLDLETNAIEKKRKKTPLTSSLWGLLTFLKRRAEKNREIKNAA